MCARWVAAVLCLVLLTAFAPAPLLRRERRAEKNFLSMEGEWQGGYNLVIKGDRLTYNPRTSPAAYFVTFDTSVRPAVYELRSGTHQGPAQYTGIWKVEGNKLTLCYNGGTQRPLGFEGQGKGAITEVFSGCGDAPDMSQEKTAPGLGGRPGAL